MTWKGVAASGGRPIRLILYSCSVLLYQGMQYIDRAGKMGLLKYSTGEFLDNLAALKKVERLSAQTAQAKVRFTLSALREESDQYSGRNKGEGPGTVLGDAGVWGDPAGSQTVELLVRCLTAGSVGNGLLPGEINILVDPINYIAKIENTAVSEGGEDQETDEALAERIYLAPSAYTTAGPEDAYRYWTMSYSSAIATAKSTRKIRARWIIYVRLQGTGNSRKRISWKRWRSIWQKAIKSPLQTW